MKIAVCTFQYDSISKLYESDYELLDTKTSVLFTAPLSCSPKVLHKEVKVAIGKTEIKNLWQEHFNFLKQNEKIKKK